MRVLLLGSGGREHALAWKLCQSPRLGELICAPGNPGMARLGRTLPVNLGDPRDVLRVARVERPDLVVVGPELPLVNGAVDALTEAGFLTFGPSAEAARMEGSKAFAKQVMAEAQVPTARSRVFDSADEAAAYAASLPRVVVKADGLAAGKGVIVAQSPEAGVEAVRLLGALPGSGARLVLEEVLEGEEISVIALTDGERCALLPVAQDHKRVGDGDQGPNTGGMGAYAPVARVEASLLAQVEREIIEPVLRVLRAHGTPFRGALYAGLILTADGPKVIEFNARLGDPEAQVLMMQLEEDLLPLLEACARGTLAARALRMRAGAAVGVVLAAEGYPGSVRSGDAIGGADLAEDGVEIFHAGTVLKDGQLLTAGGRVLTVCGRGRDLAEARRRAYAAAERIQFRGRHFRRDIGARGLTP